MGLHAQLIGELVKLCCILWGFYIMEIHAHLIVEFVN